MKPYANEKRYASPPTINSELADLVDWWHSYTGARDHNPPEASDVALLQWVFSSGLCYDFAHMLHQATGWPVVEVTASADSHDKPCALFHELVRSPDGRLLDAEGWTTAAALAERFGEICLREVEPKTLWIGFEELLDDDWITTELLDAKMREAARALPYAPFNEDWLQQALAPQEVTAPSVGM